MSRWLGLVGPSAGGLAKPCKTVPFTRSFIVKVNSSVELVGLQSVAKKGFFSNKFLTLTKREREKKDYLSDDISVCLPRSRVYFQMPCNLKKSSFIHAVER